MKSNTFYVGDYGAVPDGKTDCTKALQEAVDKAGESESGGLVLLDPGVYRIGTVRLLPHVKVQGADSWGFQSCGGTVLKPAESISDGMLDITGAYGCSVSGLCLDGENAGDKIHGILFLREDFFDRKEEDSFTIANCKIRNFTGAGLYLQSACCFSLRHSHIFENEGDGIYLNSWDGFLMDNWFSANGGWGIRCASEGFNNSAMTVVGNRIEWNKKGGFFIQNGKLWNINGNMFDRNGGPAIHIAAGIRPTPDMDPRWVKIDSHAILVNGNLFNRSAADFDGTIEEENDCHIRMERCFNVTVSGNTMLAGMGDGRNDGKRSPAYGMVIEGLKGSAILDNNMYKGYTKQAVKDLGGHGMQLRIENNLSGTVPPRDFDESGHMMMRLEHDGIL